MKKLFTTVTLLAGLFAGSVNAATCTGAAHHKDGGTVDIIVSTDDMYYDDNLDLYRAETKWQPRLASTLFIDEVVSVEGVAKRGLYTAVATDTKEVILIADDLVCYD